MIEVMKIIVDIVHMADVNFFKSAIYELEKKGHTVFVTTRERGKLIDVLSYEINSHSYVFGKHYKNIFCKMRGMLSRTVQLAIFIIANRIDIVTGFGSFYVAIAAKLTGRQSIIYHDDPEYALTYKICKMFASKLLIPNSVRDTGWNVDNKFDFKELAYLHNTRFVPDERALTSYNLIPYEYVFVRDVANISMNYSNVESIMRKYAHYFSKMGIKVVASIENGKCIYNNVIILSEPVPDIYSLIYFAKYVFTSGDTVAREAAILGVPTIYTGKRNMAVNNLLIKRGYLKLVENLPDLDNYSRKNVDENWIDTTSVIVKSLEKQCR